MQNNKKFNLSFKRLASRILLTFILGIVFGVAMFPFLQVANGLLDTQQAAIGWQNFLKMVALWGIFTALVAIPSFLKKRFRMTAVLLVICWFISIGVLIWIKNRDVTDNVAACEMAAAYSIDPAFSRALDLIQQREQITDQTATYIGFAFQNRNCLDIQFTDDNNLLGSAEGVFMGEDPTIQNLKIYLKEEYKDFDDLTLALLLVHELAHVGQQVAVLNNPEISSDCYMDEARAFYEQNYFLLLLNDEEKRSIVTRIKDNMNKNPIFEVSNNLGLMHNDVYNACNKQIQENLLTEEQYDQCFEQGMLNKLSAYLKESDFYKTQCSKR